MKIIIDYDPTTLMINIGGISTTLCIPSGYTPEEYVPGPLVSDQKTVVALAESGVTPDQLIEMKDKGVI